MSFLDDRDDSFEIVHFPANEAPSVNTVLFDQTGRTPTSNPQTSTGPRQECQSGAAEARRRRGEFDERAQEVDLDRPASELDTPSKAARDDEPSSVAISAEVHPSPAGTNQVPSATNLSRPEVQHRAVTEASELDVDIQRELEENVRSIHAELTWSMVNVVISLMGAIAAWLYFGSFAPMHASLTALWLHVQVALPLRRYTAHEDSRRISSQNFSILTSASTVIILVSITCGWKLTFYLLAGRDAQGWRRAVSLCSSHCIVMLCACAIQLFGVVVPAINLACTRRLRSLAERQGRLHPH